MNCIVLKVPGTAVQGYVFASLSYWTGIVGRKLTWKAKVPKKGKKHKR